MSSNELGEVGRQRERGGAKASRSWEDGFGVWSNRGAGAAVRSERTGVERVRGRGGASPSLTGTLGSQSGPSVGTGPGGATVLIWVTQTHCGKLIRLKLPW